MATELEVLETDEIEIDDEPDYVVDEALIEESATVPVKSAKPKLVQRDAAAEPEEIAPVAELSLFKGGAMAFRETAELLAEELGLELKESAKKPGLYYVRLEQDQIEEAREVIADRGMDVIERQSTSIARVNGEKLTIMDEAALTAAEALGINHLLTRSDKGRDRLVLPVEREEEVVAVLREAHFSVKVDDIQSTVPPKVVFKEAPDGETYYVYDASATNVAKFLQTEPNQTPGGRPMMEFSRQEMRELKTQLNEAKYDVSTKDLKLNAQISHFETKNGVGAVLVGVPAQEVAGALEMDIEWTKRSARTGRSMPKLVLRGENAVQAAKQVLQEQGYKIEENQMEQRPFANVTVWNGEKPGAIVFGDAAESLANSDFGKAQNLKLEATQKGSSMVRLTLAQLEPAKTVLTDKGFNVEMQDAAKTYKQVAANAPTVQKAAPVKKVRNDDGR